jgi:phosphate transport system substrate-binding protein
MKLPIRALAVSSIPAWLALVSSCAMWGEEGAKPPPAAAPPAAASATTQLPPVAVATAPMATPTAPPSDASGGVVRMRGSNTVGASLAPRLALAFLQHSGASDAAMHERKEENHVTVSGTLGGKPVSFEIDSPGSKVAFECLADHSCDIGMSSRPIQLEEVTQLAGLGDMTSPAAEHVIALDGIAIVVNRANRVNKLTVQQIANLFEGKTKTWAPIEGAGGEVHLYIRDKKSGTYDTFLQFVTHGRDLPADRARVTDNEGISAGVAGDEGAIGFVGLAYVGANKAVAVQDGDATALAPTPFSVATEDYPFSRRLYLYTPPASLAPLAAGFVDFALSDDGQKVVAQTGFVGLNVTASEERAAGRAPDGYTKATTGAHRLSFNLRFKTNTTALDGKATQDLDRVVRYIKATTNESHAIELLGFADNQGDEAHNVELSEHRAKTVAEELAKRGVVAQVVTGFGSARPIAPNDTPEGRNKNRRVEVWLK